jgi:uncharacterized DUF497 family protein
MDAHFLYAGQRFRWDMRKAHLNFSNHGIRFEQACEVFLDPLLKFLDATADDEAREAVLGLAEDWTLLFVVHVVREPGVIRIISARHATSAERSTYEDQS